MAEQRFPEPWQIRAGRASVGWSREELASKSGVSVPTISRYERGVGDIRASSLGALADALRRVRIVFDLRTVAFQGSVKVGWHDG